jgi:hypothetical protein
MQKKCLKACKAFLEDSIENAETFVAQKLAGWAYSQPKVAPAWQGVLLRASVQPHQHFFRTLVKMRIAQEIL